MIYLLGLGGRLRVLVAGVQLTRRPVARRSACEHRARAAAADVRAGRPGFRCLFAAVRPAVLACVGEPAA